MTCVYKCLLSPHDIISHTLTVIYRPPQSYSRCIPSAYITPPICCLCCKKVIILSYLLLYYYNSYLYSDLRSREVSGYNLTHRTSLTDNQYSADKGEDKNPTPSRQNNKLASYREETQQRQTRHRHGNQGTSLRERRLTPERSGSPRRPERPGSPRRSPRRSLRQSSSAREIIRSRVDRAKERLRRQSVTRDVIERPSPHKNSSKHSTTRDKPSSHLRGRDKLTKLVSPIKQTFKSPPLKSQLNSTKKTKHRSPKESKLKSSEKSKVRSAKKDRKSNKSCTTTSPSADESLVSLGEESISDLYELKQSLLRELSCGDTPVTVTAAVAVTEDSNIHKQSNDKSSLYINGAVIDNRGGSELSEDSDSNSCHRLQIDLGSAAAVEEGDNNMLTTQAQTPTQTSTNETQSHVGKPTPHSDLSMSISSPAAITDTTSTGKENQGGLLSTRSTKSQVHQSPITEDDQLPPAEQINQLTAAGQ